MNALYLSTTGDTTTVFPFPLQLQGYGCAVIEINGKIQSPRRDMNGPMIIYIYAAILLKNHLLVMLKCLFCETL